MNDEFMITMRCLVMFYILCNIIYDLIVKLYVVLVCLFFVILPLHVSHVIVIVIISNFVFVRVYG